MEKLKMIHPLLILTIVFIVTACANRCSDPVLVPEFFKQETSQQRLMREKQDLADYSALQLEKMYERMSDEERMNEVVY